MERRSFIGIAGSVGIGSMSLPALAGPMLKSSAQTQWDQEASVQNGAETRGQLLSMLTTMVRPVWKNLAADSLRQNMPVETAPGNPMNRAKVTHLEAIARSLVGLAPWLCLPESGNPAFAAEEQQRRDMKKLVIKGLEVALNPKSKDYQVFEGDPQLLVDAAFLAYAMLMPGAWDALFLKLNSASQEALVDGWLATRKIKPYRSNWLLFSAMVELALEKAGETKLISVIDTAMDAHQSWYKGDGLYGDGPELHVDYYNSYVIHPFLDHIFRLLPEYKPAMAAQQKKRSDRHAMLQLRSIMPDGSFPLVGRSLTYRCGMLHHLAYKSYMETLPASIALSTARDAIKRCIAATLKPASYSTDGWLRLGVSGSQPSMAEVYLSTGSMYLASAAFMPLGLAADHPFWTAPAQALPNDLWANGEVPTIDAAYKE